jgi:hypothetical protein
MKIAIILILIILILHFIKTDQIYVFNNELIKKNINEIQYKTGDVIFFRHDSPLYFYGDNGINMDIHVVKNISKTLFHFAQPFFSHCGIVIIRDNIPFVLHLTADDNYDNYNKKSIIGCPVLTSMSELYKYKGVLYHNEYIGPPITNIESILKDIYSKDIYLDGNIFNAFMVNIMNISTHKKNSMVCCDFVVYVMEKFGIVREFKYCDLNYVHNICKTSKNYATRQTIIKTQLFKCLR